MDKRLKQVRKRLLTNSASEADAPTRLNFVNQLLLSQVRVLEEHTRDSVTQDNCHLRDVQPKLKEA